MRLRFFALCAASAMTALAGSAAAESGFVFPSCMASLASGPGGQLDRFEYDVVIGRRRCSVLNWSGPRFVGLREIENRRCIWRLLFFGNDPEEFPDGFISWISDSSGLNLKFCELGPPLICIGCVSASSDVELRFSSL